jgi:hypothetical protein
VRAYERDTPPVVARLEAAMRAQAIERLEAKEWFAFASLWLAATLAGLVAFLVVRRWRTKTNKR